MDPWHVVRWCTELRVHRLLVENVPEFVDWGPCDVRTGKPIKARKGEYFRAWLAALKAIGMHVDHKILTCADYGDATTRERFFLTGRSDKKALRWPEASHARPGEEADLLGTRKTWRSAAEIIDWSRPGNSIFTRKRPLVKNTISRLLAGAKRNHWPKQHLKALQALLDGKKPRLRVTAEEAEVIAKQLGIPLVMATGSNGAARGADKPIASVTGQGGSHFAEPIILHKANSTGGRSARGVGEPAPTVTTNGAGALVQPIITPYYGGGSGKTGQSASEPLPAQGTRDRFAVATPTLIRAGHGDDRHTHDGRVLDGADPVPAITGSNEIGIAVPFLVPNFGERPGQEPRTRSIADPAPTICGSNTIAVAQPFVAHITHHDQSNRSRPVTEPLPTVTGANRGELALVVPGIADGYYIDILYRMLHWSELARATSFEDEGRAYHFTGTATEITKQIGNAVPIRTGAALCAAAFA